MESKKLAKKVVITGGGGQDGQLITKLHLDRGDRVLSIVRKLPVSPSLKVNYLQNENLILDSQSLGKLVQEVQPDIFYHFASVHGPSGTMNESETRDVVIATGLKATQNIHEAVARFSPRTRIITTLSSRMYTLELEAPINEDTPVSPGDFYGDTKALMWDCVRNARTNSGLDTACSILFNHDSVLKQRGYLSWDIAEQIFNVNRGITDRIRLRQPFARGDFSDAFDVCVGMFLQANQEVLEDFVLGAGASSSIERIVQLTLKELNLEPMQFQTFTSDQEIQLPFSDTARAENTLKWFRESSYPRVIAEMYGVLENESH